MAFQPPPKPVEFADLKSMLSQSKQIDPALFQTLQILIERLDQLAGNATATTTSVTESITNIVNNPPGGGGSDVEIEYLGDIAPPRVYNDGDIVVGTDGIAYLCTKDGTTSVPFAWPGGGGLTGPQGPIGPQGPPGTIGPHHATHEPGGTDFLVNSVWTNLNNVFTGVLNTFNGGVTFSPTGSQRVSIATDAATINGLFFNATGASANNKKFTISNIGLALVIESHADNDNIQNTIITFNRDGTVQLQGSLSAAGGLATTPLNASNLISGTVPNARLTPDVLRFTGGYPGGTITFLRADGTFATIPSGIPSAHHTTHEPGGSDALVNAAWTNLSNNFSADQAINKTGSESGPTLSLRWASSQGIGRILSKSEADVHITANARVVGGTQDWNLDNTGAAGQDLELSNFGLKFNIFTAGTNPRIPTTVFSVNNVGNTLIIGNLLVTKVLPQIQVQHSGNSVIGRIAQNSSSVGRADFSTNLSFNGTDLLADDISKASAQYSLIEGNHVFFTVPPGPNPRTSALITAADISSAGIRSTTDYYEKGRSVPLGHWINIPFNAANFTGNGAMTWTVTSGNIVALSYMLIGKTMFFIFNINGTTIGGTPNSELHITIPFTCAITSSTPVQVYSPGAPASIISAGGPVNGTTYIRLFNNLSGDPWGLGTGAITVGLLIFSIV